MDQPHLLASPDPLMQPCEPNLEQVAPIQMSIDPVSKPASATSTDPELVKDLEANLMSNTRPAPNGEEASGSGYDRQTRRKQECAACNDAARRIRSDYDTILSLEQRLEATNDQVVLMMGRSDKAEESILAHQNELARVNDYCDVQIAEMSNVLRTQRGQLNNMSAEYAKANNELADSKFELQRHSALTRSKERDLHNVNRRINGFLIEVS
jgi:chromosome segregation ATPase